MKNYSGWCDLESHLKNEQYFFETLPSTSKKLIVISSKINFHDALFLCRKICGRMVLPNSQEESDELSSVAKRYIKKFWIRFSDADKEGDWRDFDNNAAVNFSNWESSQPNEGTSGNFAYMYLTGELYDVNWNNSYNVVCELPYES